MYLLLPLKSFAFQWPYQDVFGREPLELGFVSAPHLMRQEAGAERISFTQFHRGIDLVPSANVTIKVYAVNSGIIGQIRRPADLPATLQDQVGIQIGDLDYYHVTIRSDKFFLEHYGSGKTIEVGTYIGILYNFTDVPPILSHT